MYLNQQSSSGVYLLIDKKDVEEQDLVKDLRSLFWCWKQSLLLLLWQKTYFLLSLFSIPCLCMDGEISTTNA